jgi:hypothetical protein
MTAGAKLGKFEIRFSGGATRAYDRASFCREESVFAVAAVEQKSSTTSVDPFAALSHEYRITNGVVAACEEDSPIKSFAAKTTGELYRGSRGRLLVFKNTR